MTIYANALIYLVTLPVRFNWVNSWVDHER
ncbi:hypothetical protein [Caudoviricetes sp.]|nr:hypothetical protein [Caudoviricetes sp.]